MPRIRGFYNDKEAYFFLVLADKDGFTMRSPAWTEAGTSAATLSPKAKANRAQFPLILQNDCKKIHTGR